MALLSNHARQCLYFWLDSKILEKCKFVFRISTHVQSYTENSAEEIHSANCNLMAGLGWALLYVQNNAYARILLTVLQTVELGSYKQWVGEN